MSLLAGVRVLDLSRVMSGPYCTALLADLGAEVIKVESPGTGDDSRRFGPYMNGASLYFALLNRGKKSIALNLKHEKAQHLARQLARDCDVVVENFRPGVTARLGLDYATLAAIQPRLIYLSISGFGQQGPYAERPAYDLIVQAMSGIMSITGQPDGPPTAVGESVADVATGMFGAFAVATALFERSRSGRGRHIDLAMFDSLVAMQLTGLARLWASGKAPERVGNRHPVTTPVDSFRAADGAFVMVVPSDPHFHRLCALMGAPQLADDARFKDNASRAEHQSALKALIERWSDRLTVQELLRRCAQADIPAGPVWDLKQVAESEHSSARQLFSHIEHRAFGALEYPPQPARFSHSPRPPAAREPILGEHTAEVLRERLRLSAAELDELVRDGAIAVG